MTATPESLSRLERHLGRIFTAGLTLSAAALVVGLMLFLFAPETPWRLFLNGGLLILMATPMLRVVVSAVEYVQMRDWFFVVLTVAVLAELSVTVIYALRGSG
jgi:uncharacterized membrane protein